MAVISRLSGLGRQAGIGSIGALVLLGACAQPPNAPSGPLGPSASASSPTPAPSPTIQPSASPLPSARALAAPADLADLVGEMRFRSGMGVTLEQFVVSWNEVAGDVQGLDLDLASIAIDPNGSFLHELESLHVLLGFVTDAGELTAIAVGDGSNLHPGGRLDRAVSMATGALARLSLIAGTERGLNVAERAALFQEIADAVRLTAGDEFFYDTRTTYATLADGVLYYLVGTTDDTLLLMAVGVQ